MLNHEQKLILDHAAWTLLQKAQHDCNSEITWKDDHELGVPDYWDFPRELGNRKFEDCDGFTLYKMRWLINAGVDPTVLSFVVCYDEVNEGHAVLCVVTDKGDYILDNRQADVMAYPELKTLGYRFIYRSAPGSKLGQEWEIIQE